MNFMLCKLYFNEAIKSHFSHIIRHLDVDPSGLVRGWTMLSGFIQSLSLSNLTSSG